MASYLRPRRGKKSTAETQAIVLKKGEVFFEIGNNGSPTTGSSATSFGKIKMGDGSTTYSSLGYFIDVDTSVVDWDNTGYATATSTNQGSDNYGNLNAITPTATMKSILGNVKALLYKLSTQVTTLNNDHTDITTIKSNLTTTVSGSSVSFKFVYDSTSGTYGYKNASDTFVSFGGTSAISAVTFTTITLLASGWSNGIYSLESNYPRATYNLFIGPSPSMTEDEYIAAGEASFTGDATYNRIKALGKVPTVSIPVLVRVETKG